MSILGNLSGGILSGAADIIGKFVGDPDKEKRNKPRITKTCQFCNRRARIYPTNNYASPRTGYGCRTKPIR